MKRSLFLNSEYETRLKMAINVSNGINSIAKGAWKVLIRITGLVFLFFRESSIQLVLRAIVEALSLRSTRWLTFHLRPKLAKDNLLVRTIPPRLEFSKTAIVVQGPVVTKDDLTIETLKLYRRFAPEATLILSTWVGANSRVLEIAKSIGVTVVLSEMPTNRGRWNINLQRRTTLAGIKSAKDSGSVFVLKTRTDQRIGYPEFLTYLFSLMFSFPLIDECPERLLESRIVVTSLNSYFYRPYSISDMLHFGRINDIYSLWNFPEDDVGHSIPSDYNTTIEAQLRLGFPEQIILETGLFKRLISGRNHLRTTWELLKNYFIVCDAHSIDLFWMKYTSFFEFRDRIEDAHGSGRFCTFGDWLWLINCDLSNICIDEDSVLKARKPQEIPPTIIRMYGAQEDISTK